MKPFADCLQTIDITVFSTDPFMTLRPRRSKRQMICTPFTGHPVEGVLLCGTHMSTKGNV